MASTKMDFKQLLADVAANELNETPEKTRDYLAMLRDWIKMQPHLNVRDDDKFLISFLRNTKYRLELTKEKLDFYHTFRTKFAEYYTDRCPFSPGVRRFLEKGTLLPMPKPNIDGGRIVISMLGEICKNDHNFTVVDYLKKDVVIHDRISIYDDHSTIVGQHIIIDFKGTNLTLATQSTPILKVLATGMENVYPIRFKRIHLVNVNEAPQIFRVLIKTIVGLFKGKIAKRVVVYDGLDGLYDEIPRDNLPNELGGTAGTCETIMKQNYYDLIFESEKWFAEDILYRSDETKRMGGSKIGDIYGVQGSFRKLELD